jgi:hypothetical protein
MDLRVKWRRVLFIGMLWACIVDGPGACQWIWQRLCNYLILETCE